METSPQRRLLHLRRALHGHRPADDRERRSLALILRELERLPAPLDETADPTHVTGSALVTDGRGGLVLHRHKRLGRWMQPGGHLQPDESPPDAAVRETREETGLAAAHPGRVPHLLHVDVHPGPRGHVHLDLRYLLVAPDDRGLRPDPGESPDVAWFDLDAALAIADASLAGAIRALWSPA